MLHSVWNFWTFVTVIGLLFSLFMVLTGIFTTYFGSGKSRAIGAVLLVVGLIVGILIVMFTTSVALPNNYFDKQVAFKNTVLETIGYIVAAAIGALVALGIFLVAIMKA